MKLTYTNVNGYLIPNLTYKSGEQMEQLGKYGFLRRDYLKNYRNSTYQMMLLQDTIGEHLLEVDKAAREREEVILKQLEEKEPLPDKEKDQMAWVRAANQHKAIAEEIILNAAWYRDERKCSHKSISEEKLQKIVRSELTRQFRLSDLRKKDMSAISSAVFLTKIKEIQAEIRKLDADMERHSEKLAQAFMQYKEDELSKEAYIEMKDDRNNWKVFCEERKKSLEQTIRKLEKQQKEEARFLRSLLELDGTTRINAELVESLIESMYLYGDNRLEINFGFKGAVEYE